MISIWNCQVDWVAVLLIVCQEFTIPFLEHVQLYIEISSNEDGNRALVVAVNLMVAVNLSSFSSIGTSFMISSQVDLFLKDKFWKPFACPC